MTTQGWRPIFLVTIPPTGANAPPTTRLVVDIYIQSVYVLEGLLDLR